MATVAVVEEEVYDPDFGRWWWVFLITGTLWLILSMIIFRFDITSVKSIGIMAGIVFLFAAAAEFVMVAVVRSGWWKALNAILGVLLAAGGIFCFIRPGEAFIAGLPLDRLFQVVTTVAPDPAWLARQQLSVAEVSTFLAAAPGRLVQNPDMNLPAGQPAGEHFGAG